jgi:hypothetical protein
MIVNMKPAIATALVLVAFALPGSSARAQTPAAAAGSDALVDTLTKELGVTPEQASGGAGSLFALAKGKMAPAEFAQVAKAVPEMDGLLKAAPAAGGGGMASLGTMASAAGSFQKLGMSPSMVGKFVPVLTKFVGASGGADTASLLAGALK